MQERVSKEEWSRAVEFLIKHYHRKTFQEVWDAMQKEGEDWWGKRHYGFGTDVRNVLRQGGFAWGAVFLDDNWYRLMEEATRRILLFRNCPTCGKEIQRDAKFCSFCRNPIPGNTNLAGFWIRLGAYIMDVIIVVIIFLIFTLITELSWNETADAVIMWIAIILYQGIFLSLLSATPGKILFGLRVVRQDDFEKLGARKAWGRALGYILSHFVFFAGFWSLVFNKTKQGWHDKLSKTLVIRESRRRVFFAIPITFFAIIVLVATVFVFDLLYSDFSYPGEFFFTTEEKKIYEEAESYIWEHNLRDFSYYLDEAPEKSKVNYWQIIKEKPRNQEKPRVEITLDAKEIFGRNREAVVTVVVQDHDGSMGHGSGFVVDGSSLIVTNYHVVEDTGAVVVVTTDDKIFPIEEIIAKSILNDLVVLRIKESSFPQIFLSETKEVEIGEKLYSIGNPEGLRNTLADGIVSSVREVIGEGERIQMTVPISPGSSGGPIFNSSGEVIGVAQLIFEGQSLNFAIPVKHLREMLGVEVLED